MKFRLIPTEEFPVNFQEMLRIVRKLVTVLVFVMLAVIAAAFIFSMNDGSFCYLVSGKAQVAHGYWEMETGCAYESGFW